MCMHAANMEIMDVDKFKSEEFILFTREKMINV